MKLHIEVDPNDADDVAAARDVLDRLVDAGKAPAKGKGNKARKAAPKKEEPAADADEDEGGGYTLEQVRKALKDHAALEGKDAAIRILKDNGAASVSELEPGKFASVMEALGEV